MAAVAGELGDLPGVTIGIGAIDAAISMARRLCEDCVDGVVLVGTCGAYTTDFPIGTVIRGDGLSWRPLLTVVNLAYEVAPRPPIQADPALATFFDAPWAEVVTTPAITTDPGLVASMADRAAVEHLETWGVARACAEAGVPFVPILGVANPVGPDAHALWVRHRAQAEQAARDVVRAGLDAMG